MAYPLWYLIRDQASSLHHKSSRPCRAQDAMLNLVFSVTSCFYCLASLAAGHISYRYGTRVTRLVATTVFFLGSMAIAFTSKDTPWLIFIGTCLVSGGGITYFMTNVQISLLFPKAGSLVIGLLVGGFEASTVTAQAVKISLLFPKAGSLVIGLLVGGFEASTVTAQAVKLGYVHGISLRTSFIILGLAQLLTLVSTFLFLPKDFIKKEPDPAFLGTGSLQESIEKSKELRKPEKLPPLKSLVLSPTYLLHLYWTAVLQFRFMCVLGSLNVTLERLLPSKQEVSKYTDITAYILLFGIFIAPVVGAFNDSQTKRFRVLPLVLGTTMGVAMSAALLVERAVIVCLAFIILIIMRAFIYTVLSGLLLAVYPNEYYGSMLSIILMACGALNLLQNPLFAWASSASFDQVNTLLLIMTASTFIHPLYQWWALRQEKLLPSSLFTDDEQDNLCDGSETNEYDALSTLSD
ncbi:hypothetical protein RRG08_050482 [Elysia crispata]|uniref:Uncharacterized protein n=1 Tax=Elysia crispata TaxID=231223 RepID=A0AAE0YB21_9GAST|nr:hypothetical protein RRG08_050482 [Elysia crispata]